MDYTFIKDTKVIFTQNPEDIDRIFELFQEIGKERGWQVDDLKQYIPVSLFWYIEQIGQIIAAMQLVVCAGKELPIACEQGWPKLAILEKPDISICEVALVAVKKNLRGSSFLFLPLYISMYHYCKRHKITHWLAILDSVICRLYKRLNINFIQIDDEKIYWGEMTFPALLALSDLENDLFQKNPKLWEIVLSAS